MKKINPAFNSYHKPDARINFDKINFPQWLSIRPIKGISLIAPIFAFCFGLLLLTFVLSPGDGMWNIYAKEINSGKNLYLDLHSHLQPLFTALYLLPYKFFGDLLIPQKIVFALILFLYVSILYKLVAIIEDSEIKKIILFLAVFFTTLGFEAHRFDDYHAFTELLVLLSLFYSIALLKDKIDHDKYCIIQGIILCIALLTRINEGLTLIASVCFIILCQNLKFKKLLKLLLLALIPFLLIFSATLLFYKISPQEWFHYTFASAATAKGGIYALIHYPWLLIQESWVFLRYGNFLMLRFFMLHLDFNSLALVPILIITLLLIQLHRYSHLKVLARFIAEGIILYWIVSYSDSMINSITAIVTILLPILSCIFFAQWLFASITTKSAVVAESSSTLSYKPIIIYPFMLFFWGSLSAGGYFRGGLQFPLAITMIALYLIFRAKLNSSRFSVVDRIMLFSFFAYLAFIGVIYKYYNPYSWHSYHVQPLFKNYTLTSTRHLGPHLITNELSTLIKPVCSIVNKGPGALLSIPFPFANYYCRIPVWNGYVQTFFDTSTAEDIKSLQQQLLKSPPRYIFYQKQIKNLKMHEKIYNEGKRLPQHDLDELIMKKISWHHWKIVYTSKLYPPSTWYLIDTAR